MNEQEKTETAVSTIELVQRAEIDMQISTAKKYPRQLSMVKRDMMSFATLDEETAAACFYSLPRGGKSIQGPSVRLAEIAVSCYGNIRAGSRVIEVVTSGDSPHVTIQAVAHDLEKNIAITIEKRRRITPKWDRKLNVKKPIDEDDINLAANAGSAVAFRDAVFKVVPGALVKPVFEQAKRVAVGDQKTLAQRRDKCIETFGKMGIGQDKILAHLSKTHVEDIGLADLEELIGLHSAIKDGALNIDEAFPVVKPKEAGFVPAAPAARIPDEPKPMRRTTPAPQPAPKPEPAPEPEPPTEPAAPEITGTHYDRVVSLLDRDDILEEEVIGIARRKSYCKPEQSTLLEFSDARLQTLLDNWDVIAAQIRIDRKAGVTT